MKNKIIALSAVIAIIAILAVGSTLAWFTDTAQASNTFTVGNVSITLDEARVDNYGKKIENAERVLINNYPIVPGDVLDKDPTVTVKGGSAECWVYVYIDNQIQLNDEVFARPDINRPSDDSSGWEDVPGKPGLYRYSKIVEGKDEEGNAADIRLIAVFDKVTIDHDITNTKMNELAMKDPSPNIIVKAFAIQADNVTEEEAHDQAWSTLNPSSQAQP